MTDFEITCVPFGQGISAEDITEDLAFFDDWEERYRYIIDLGKQLPSFPEDMKTEDRIVRGCQSQVWLEAIYDQPNDRILLAVDSDALIVRGLAAIVLAALNNKHPQHILDYDMDSYFRKLDLLTHISPTRGNGIRAMVQRIRQKATEYA